MNLCSEKLPPLRISILLWDNSKEDWFKAQLQDNHGTKFWVLEPRMYHGVDNSKFTHWTELPGRPQ